jgi:hypothetical protein
VGPVGSQYHEASLAFIRDISGGFGRSVHTEEISPATLFIAEVALDLLCNGVGVLLSSTILCESCDAGLR